VTRQSTATVDPHSLLSSLLSTGGWNAYNAFNNRLTVRNGVLESTVRDLSPVPQVLLTSDRGSFIETSRLDQDHTRITAKSGSCNRTPLLVTRRSLISFVISVQASLSLLALITARGPTLSSTRPFRGAF